MRYLVIYKHSLYFSFFIALSIAHLYLSVQFEAFFWSLLSQFCSLLSHAEQDLKMDIEFWTYITGHLRNADCQKRSLLPSCTVSFHHCCSSVRPKRITLECSRLVTVSKRDLFNAFLRSHCLFYNLTQEPSCGRGSPHYSRRKPWCKRIFDPGLFH